MFVFHAMVSCLLLIVIWLDFTRYTIPNWLNGLLLALYPALVLLGPAPVDWPEALLPALAMFIVCALLFFLRVMGGGDVKLLAVSGLWMGKAAILEFIVFTAVLGGVLTLVLLILRPITPWVYGRFLEGRTPPRVLTMDQPVPYGVAIAMVFLWMMWKGLVPGLPAPVWG
ncbi:MAG: prepilin peptidase [Alphaproteobacteria bacterium]|nr:prepilin peptidase [Alphaproteobacteria bacterium]